MVERRMLTRRGLIGAACIGAMMGATARAMDPAEAERLAQDFPNFARYRADNAALAARAERVEAVFMGDSITEGWLSQSPKLFESGRICRGISGQTTAQMLLRFRADVINLRPRVVHVMAGTNDIAANTGPTTNAMIEDNIASMVDIARSNGVRVVLGAVTPADQYGWRPGVDPRARISDLNHWLADHARATHSVFVDYYTAMSDGAGAMRAGLSDDHVHPTAAGYAVMAPLALEGLRRAAHQRS